MFAHFSFANKEMYCMMHIPEQFSFFRSGFLTQLALLAAFLFAFPAYAQKVNIAVSLKGVQNDTLILGYPLGAPNVLKHADTLVLRKGKGAFRSDSLYPAGLYCLITDGKKYDFLMPKADQQFRMAFDTTNFLQSVRVKGSVENRELYRYMQYMADQRSILLRLEEELGKWEESRWNSPGEKDEKTSSIGGGGLRPEEQMEVLEGQIEEVQQRVKQYSMAQIKAHEQNIFGKFLKAYSEIELPVMPLRPDGLPVDSFFAYRYYREHYFDNADYADPDLMRMPLMGEKISTYASAVLPMIPDTVITEADRMLTRAKGNKETFKVVLTALFDTYLQSDMVAAENVWVHLAEKWFFPYADWATPEYSSALKEEVEARKKTLIGAVAPALDVTLLPPSYFRKAGVDSLPTVDKTAGEKVSALSLLDGKVNLLYFWEPECGHCQIYTPELYAIYNKYKEMGMRVVTVQTNNSDSGRRAWVDFVNRNGLYNWPLTWVPDSYQYKIDYNLLSSPQIFLIEGGSGRILIKNVPVEQIEEITQMIIKPN